MTELSKLQPKVVKSIQVLQDLNKVVVTIGKRQSFGLAENLYGIKILCHSILCRQRPLQPFQRYDLMLYVLHFCLDLVMAGGRGGHADIGDCVRWTFRFKVFDL